MKRIQNLFKEKKTAYEYQLKQYNEKIAIILV